MAIAIVHQVPVGDKLPGIIIIEIRESETMGVLMTEDAKGVVATTTPDLRNCTIGIYGIGDAILLELSGIAVIIKIG